jgi:hypothetical protein
LTSEKFKGVRLNIDPGLLRIASSNAEQEEAMERARAQVRLHSAAPVQTMYHPPTYLLRITSPHMYIKRRTASLSPL